MRLAQQQQARDSMLKACISLKERIDDCLVKCQRLNVLPDDLDREDLAVSLEHGRPVDDEDLLAPSPAPDEEQQPSSTLQRVKRKREQEQRRPPSLLEQAMRAATSVPALLMSKNRGAFPEAHELLRDKEVAEAMRRRQRSRRKGQPERKRVRRSSTRVLSEEEAPPLPPEPTRNRFTVSSRGAFRDGSHARVQQTMTQRGKRRRPRPRSAPTLDQLKKLKRE